MYQTIGIANCLTWFGMLCAIVIVANILVARALARPLKLRSASDWWKLASGSVTATALGVSILGQTPLFPYVCRLPLIRSYFPNIDGEWSAVISSNWPILQQRTSTSSNIVLQNALVVRAKVKIRSRLFFINMTFQSDNDYSNSETLVIEPQRGEQSGEIKLYYIYENHTNKPTVNDSPFHYGAGFLELKDDNNWRGYYWTNRNWEKGMNTAGEIVLKR